MLVAAVVDPVSGLLSVLAVSAGLAAAARWSRQSARPRSTRSAQAPAPDERELEGAPTAVEARRVSDEILRPLGERLERGQRLSAAEVSVRALIDGLGEERWMAVQAVRAVDGIVVPFLLIGSRGVFALAASDGHWTLGDLRIFGRAAGAITALLPGYPDPVRSAIVLPYDSIEPRAWYGPDGSGVWILGGDRFYGWLTSFSDHGFSASDVARLRERAHVQWDRRASPNAHRVRTAKG